VCHVPADLLNDGRHRVAVTILRDHVPILRQEDALVFDLRDSGEDRLGWYGKWPGAIRPRLRWDTDIPVAAPASG
jgi:lipopolysaccharide transport system ATP-binding protein